MNIQERYKFLKEAGESVVIVNDGGFEFIARDGDFHYYCEDCRQKHMTPDGHAVEYGSDSIYCEAYQGFDVCDHLI